MNDTKIDREKMMEIRKSAITAVAKDLHDGVLQDLIAMLQILRNRSRKLQDTELVKENETLIGLLEKSIESIRSISNGLAIPKFEAGLLAAIRELCESQETITGKKLKKCEIGGAADKLSDSDKINIYRIVQEALSNIRRHADADDVSVTFTAYDDCSIMLEIKDNGRGFDYDSVQTVADVHLMGMGLSNIKERVRDIGAVREIKSVDGQGTTITIERKGGCT